MITKVQKLKKAKGFSLVELMAVIAIIGVLAAIAMASYSRYMGRSQVESARVALLKQAQYLSRVYTQNMSYKSVEESSIPQADNKKQIEKFYTFSAELKDDTFKLTAAPTENALRKDYLYADQSGVVFICKTSQTGTSHKSCPRAA